MLVLQFESLRARHFGNTLLAPKTRRSRDPSRPVASAVCASSMNFDGELSVTVIPDITSEVCAPANERVVPPTSEPNKATPCTLPVCRVAFSTPAAMPDRDFSVLPSISKEVGWHPSPEAAPTRLLIKPARRVS
jgi:hypothetical protein